MITAIIIDDEAKGRLALREKIINYCTDVKLVGEAANGQEGLALIRELKPQLVFLDIEMPRMNGFDMLNELQEKKFHLVFTTAYNQYAIKAIKFAAFDYLLKPVDVEELRTTVKKLSELDINETKKQLELLQQSIFNHKQPVNKLAIPTTDGLLFFELDEIVHLEANSNYTNIYFSNRPKIIASKTLKEFEELLPDDQFFRPHHSYIINLKYLKRYIRGDGGQIELQTGVFIDVSRRKKDEFLKRINVY